MFNPFVQGIDMWNQLAERHLERVHGATTAAIAVEAELVKRAKQTTDRCTAMLDENLALAMKLVEHWHTSTMTIARKSVDMFTSK